jgi:hypothetical protein
MKLLDYMRGFDDVWFCTGADIAHHWRDNFPAVPVNPHPPSRRAAIDL